MADGIFKGGRGQKAPYSSTHLRVPVRITLSIQKIINVYKRAYQLDADSLISRLEKSLAEYADNFSPQYNSLANSKTFVPLEKYQLALSASTEATQEINLLRQTISDMEDNRRKAKVILQDALILKPNAGGAIKKEIVKAIESIS